MKQKRLFATEWKSSSTSRDTNYHINLTPYLVAIFQTTNTVAILSICSSKLGLENNKYLTLKKCNYKY